MSRIPPSSFRFIPRPILETILNNHAHHHRLPHPLLLHGPRGSGKSSLLLSRLLPQWSQPPHVTAFVDLDPTPTWAHSSPKSLSSLKSHLESSLQTLALSAIAAGALSSRDFFRRLAASHSLSASLRRLSATDDRRRPLSQLWHKAVFNRIGSVEIGDADVAVVAGGGEMRRGYGVEEAAFVREGVAAMGVAREVIEMDGEWRREAVREMNRSRRFARSLVDLATDWPVLLVELLSDAAEVDFFQVLWVERNSRNPKP